MSYKQKFIDQVKDGAIRGWQKYKILPSLTIAQAILESDWGRSELAVQGNNLFGIKGNYKGNSITVKTKEYINGKWITVDAQFAKYPDQEKSVEEHGAFFSSTKWREDNYSHVFGETDYKKAVRAILPPKAKAGYATDNNYDAKIINIIEQYNLSQYDKDINQITLSSNIEGIKIMKFRTDWAPVRSGVNCSGYGNPKRYVTIHQTGNLSRGANADMHARLQKNNPRNASWHWQVDSIEAVQSFPHSVKCWHASDGGGPGNMQSIGIEICINQDQNYKKQVENGAKLAAWVLNHEKLTIDKMRRHYDWDVRSRKWCPAQIMNGQGGITWAVFKQMVQNELNILQGKKVASATKNPPKTSAPKSSTPWKRINGQTGVFIADYDILIRDEPHVKGNKLKGGISKGDAIAYNGLFHADGYSWLEVKDAQKGYFYFPYRQHSLDYDWGRLMSATDYNKMIHEKERNLQKYQGRGKGFKNLKLGQTITIRKGHKRWLHKNRKHMELAKKNYAGSKDKISKIADVKIGYSNKAYYLEKMKVWILEQDVVETRQ